MNTPQFRDRAHAGQMLGEALTKYAEHRDVLVLGLPRGGVPVAFAVAEKIHAPLDVLIVRKLGVPGHEEFAMGAIASGGVQVVNDEVVKALGIPHAAINQTIATQRAELQRRELAYRGAAPPLSTTGKIVILVDDGIATGSTITAAVQLLRRQKPKRLVIAVPTASTEAAAKLTPMVDEFIALMTPPNFRAVGLYYDDFEQTTDEQVQDLLSRAGQLAATWSMPPA